MMRALVKRGLMLAVGGVVLLTASTPAWSGSSTGSSSMAGTCERIIRERPVGMVNQEVVPVDGATLAPGQDVVVRLTWNPTEWSGEWLQTALDCVTVNGRLALELSAEERPTLNDGVFEHRLTIPDDVGDGCEICSEGYVAGDGPGGRQQEGSSKPGCFRVEPPGEGVAPAPEPEPVLPPELKPAQPEPLPAPPEPLPAPPAPSSRVSAGGDTAPPLTTAAPAGSPAIEPAPAPSPTGPVSLPELPRTGSPAERPLQVVGGLSLALGGLATVAGVRRWPKRP